MSRVGSNLWVACEISVINLFFFILLVSPLQYIHFMNFFVFIHFFLIYFLWCQAMEYCAALHSLAVVFADGTAALVFVPEKVS